MKGMGITMGMKIILIGIGRLGTTICTQLTGEGHDVTVIDTDESMVTELSNVCDVFGVVGNCADISVLKKARAGSADLLIAMTTEDEINILACAAAHKLGTKHTIARIRNPEYAGLVGLMREDMNLSMVINPDLAAAREIYRMLRFPSAAKITTFCRGRVELAELTVPENSPLCGHTLNELRTKLNMKFLVCTVLRDEKVYIPSGDFSILAGDVIGVTAPDEEITDFFKASGMYKQPIRNVLIVGGGRITYHLEAMLKRGKIKSTIIEKDKALCRELAEQYDSTVICDNPTKQELLLEEGIEKSDAFLALSDIDEENAIVSMYAKTMEVPKVITLISSLPYVNFFKGVGLESIISPKSTVSAAILHYVRSVANTADSGIESLHHLMDDNAEALEFVIKEEISGITGVQLKNMKSKSGVLIACIARDNEIIIPSGGDAISVGDTVMIISTGGQVKGIRDILK